MDRRDFLLGVAGAGLGFFVPKPLVTYFDMQNPTVVFGHVFWGKELGFWEMNRDPKSGKHFWTRLEGFPLEAWARGCGPPCRPFPIPAASVPCVRIPSPSGPTRPGENDG